MDVEKIQRINNLAVELERQGLADGREDAVAQARKIFNVEDHSAMDPSQMQQGSLQARNESQSSSQQVSNNNNNSHNNKPALSQDKIAEILQKNSTFLVSTIKAFQAKMEIMEQEMIHMKRKMRELASRPVAAAPAQSSSTANSNTASKGSTNPQGGDHPRSGGYNDSDVSIEKFFYMGTK